MRYLSPLLPAALVLAMACATQPAKTTPPEAPQPAESRPERSGSIPILSRGLSCNSAVPVDAANEREGVAMENAWIAENYPGANMASRTQTTCNEKPVDRVDLETANGRRVSIFFDISKWFGKAK
jgi:hypothetical protein